MCVGVVDTGMNNKYRKACMPEEQYSTVVIDRSSNGVCSVA